MKKIKLIIGTVILIFLFGCGAPKATMQLDTKAKQLKPSADKALVYVIRPSALGCAIGMKVSVNDTYIGTTGGKRYIYTFLDPGKYSITSKAENEAEILIEVQAGKTYYIEQIPKMGWLSARNQLEPLSETEGQNKISKCKLSTKCEALNKNS
ncbi:MAG: DUF2846 domain-containing protein [Bacteroidales bacterium]|nr:DUF2846 domain-containing protein [Bacteroidales bacterium]